MIKLIKKFFASSVQPICEEHTDLYGVIADLQKRIEILENENVETTNLLYELGNSIDAVDERINILSCEPIHYKTYN
jgi:uncharacterized small protein (DUF1192 family)